MKTRKAPAIAAILFVLSAVSASAQQPALAFEAASIKPSGEGEGHTGSHSRKGYLVIQNQTLRDLIRTAYKLRAEQVSGGPKWITTDRYNIEAKSAGPAEDPELLQMLQTLLADRFQLAFHKETMTFPGFALVVAKGGLKIQPVEGEGSKSHSTRGSVTAERVSMEKIADILSRASGSPVVDKTRVAGVFSFQLEWTPETEMAAVKKDGAPLDNVSTGPSIFTAVQQKLGLRLESAKVPAEVFVIDKAEKPSDN
jgi:uncharacterized protein (TIGR03435 family)